MSAPDTIAAIRALLINQHIAPCAASDATWRGEASTWDDLGMDSLDLVDLRIAVEDEFGIDLPDDVTEAIETMGELARVVDTKRAMKKVTQA